MSKFCYNGGQQGALVKDGRGTTSVNIRDSWIETRQDWFDA